MPAVNYETLYKTLEGYDVFIHPSCYADDRDCEGGAPVVLLDAQATGMPVIATRHCDIPDEVVHQKTGMLSNEKDIVGLAQSIEYFYNIDDRMFQAFSNNARNHVEENYNIVENSKNLRSIYTGIL